MFAIARGYVRIACGINWRLWGYTGVLAYAVARGPGGDGIRVALWGPDAADVLWMVVRDSLLVGSVSLLGIRGGR